LLYRHYSAVENYESPTVADGIDFPMRAEVGLLTRNIKIQGDEEYSEKDHYGAHLMVHGKTDDPMHPLYA
jgi:hypothetical protein